MPFFRKKPVVIEAKRLPGDPKPHDLAHNIAALDVANWCGGKLITDAMGECILIDTLEGQMRADPGDWIIKGIKNEFYPCKPDIFAATYEAVEGE